MQRYFLELAYKGSNYYGWQIQNNSISVQEVLIQKISIFLNEKIKVFGAGRTDKGVHASFFVAHFDSKRKDLAEISANFIYRLNRFLPKDIVLYKIFKVENHNHSRFDAKKRTYNYFIETKKNPFNQEISYFLQKKLSLEKMNEACKILFQYTDFTSFSKVNTETHTNNCKIYKAFWKKKDSQFIFEITADRFLRNMVRAIVGTMIEIGLNKISISDFKQIIENKNRCDAGTSVPAQALFLTNIIYKISN